MAIHLKMKYLAATKTPAEAKALTSLRLMQADWSGAEHDIDEVRYALEVLRSRGSRGRGEE